MSACLLAGQRCPNPAQRDYWRTRVRLAELRRCYENFSEIRSRLARLTSALTARRATRLPAPVAEA